MFGWKKVKLFDVKQSSALTEIKWSWIFYWFCLSYWLNMLFFFVTVSFNFPQKSLIQWAIFASDKEWIFSIVLFGYLLLKEIFPLYLDKFIRIPGELTSFKVDQFSFTSTLMSSSWFAGFLWIHNMSNHNMKKHNFHLSLPYFLMYGTSGRNLHCIQPAPKLSKLEAKAKKKPIVKWRDLLTPFLFFPASLSGLKPRPMAPVSECGRPGDRVVNIHEKDTINDPH